MLIDLWKNCVKHLEKEISSQQFNTWIEPLKVFDKENTLILLAPNRFIADWVKDKYLFRIRELLKKDEKDTFSISVSVVSYQYTEEKEKSPAKKALYEVQKKFKNLKLNTKTNNDVKTQSDETLITLDTNNNKTTYVPKKEDSALRSTEGLSVVADQSKNNTKKVEIEVEGSIKHNSTLNSQFRFETFVEGKSNQLALAATKQVAENAGSAYNPLFIYGGVGLGKTHLMQSVGNFLADKNKNAKIVYLHSERFVADMVKALQLNAINDFKRYYRSVDALLIDDIQFFAGKERSQEEFFYTFNALLEGGQQIVLTCDRYPKEIKGLEERLKSRFGWGLTVSVEPPELETRVAILMKKAEQSKIQLPDEAAFFIAQKIRSNVRELEGALKRVTASAYFTGQDITVSLIKESLKDLLALQEKQVSINNIQRIVSEYYKIRLSDLLSKRRSRSIARPRQVAMALSKELTNHSLPEIGEAYGGRDHTTVLHACRKIKKLCEEDSEISEDWKNLKNSLTN